MVDVIDLTRKLIGFDTINPPGNEAEAVLYLADLLRAAGFRTTCHNFGAHRMNLVARRGRHVGSDDAGAEGRPICFTGHIDTVPLGGAPWTVDPLGASLIGDRLYGRGSSDMKSGVAAMVAAAIKLGAELDDGPGLVLVLTAGEETGCEGAAHLVGIEGSIGPVGAIVVGEPTGNQPRVGHKGALWMVAESHGQTAHGSMPELGVNAIYRSMKVVAKLQDYGFNIKPHEGLGSPTLNVGRMISGLNINSVPDHSEIGLDVRTIPGMRHAEMIEHFRRYLAPELDKLATVVDLESIWTDPDDPWIRAVCSRLGVDWGETGPAGVPFFTDASVLAPALGHPPTLILGPGETAMAHQTDEYCLVDRIPEAVAIYEDIIADWQNRTSDSSSAQGTAYSEDCTEAA